MHPSYSWICLELSQSVDFLESYPRWLSTTVDRFWQKEFNSDKYHSVIIIELHSRYTKSIFYFISPDTPTNSSHYIQAHTGPVSSTTIYYHSTHWRLPDLHPPSPLSLTVTSEWVQNPKSDTEPSNLTTIGTEAPVFIQTGIGAEGHITHFIITRTLHDTLANARADRSNLDLAIAAILRGLASIVCRTGIDAAVNAYIPPLHECHRQSRTTFTFVLCLFI